MKSDRINGNDGSGRSKRARVAKPNANPNQGYTSINVERSGDWMPAEELWKAAKAALNEGKDMTFNLDKIDHLDASALQILLALDAEQKKIGRHLQFERVSLNLRHWFEYSGAAAYFPVIEQKSNE